MSTLHDHPPLLQRLLAPLIANRWVNCHLRAAGRALCRNQFWYGLLVQPWQRWHFQRRHGCVPPMAVIISPSLRRSLSRTGCYANERNTRQELSYAAVGDTLMQMATCGTQLFITGGGNHSCGPVFARCSKSFRVVGLSCIPTAR